MSFLRNVKDHPRNILSCLGSFWSSDFWERSQTDAWGDNARYKLKTTVHLGSGRLNISTQCWWQDKITMCFSSLKKNQKVSECKWPWEFFFTPGRKSNERWFNCCSSSYSSIKLIIDEHKYAIPYSQSEWWLGLLTIFQL